MTKFAHHWSAVSTGWDDKDECYHHLTFRRTPAFWVAWETVCEWSCTHIFRDRWCHRIAGPAMSAAERRTDRVLRIPVSHEFAEGYYAWRGWDGDRRLACTWEDDDE